MTDLPILFSAPMIRAIHAGKKTQTRRALVPAADHLMCVTCGASEKEFKAAKCQCPPGSLQWIPAKPPRIRKGDWLYAREHWRAGEAWDGHSPAHSHNGKPVLPIGTPIIFEADGNSTPWAGKHRQAMHLPRWASRLTLEVTSVIVQRLRDISSDDALAEGIISETVIVGAHCYGGVHSEEYAERYFFDGCDDDGYEDPISAYLGLWDHINGAGASDANPWVAAYSFEVHHGNIDEIDRLA